MSSSLKNEITASDLETDGRPLRSRVKTCIVSTVHGLRVAMTALALLVAVTMLGLSAHALHVHRSTHLPAAYLLPLWPDELDVRPTAALVAAGVIVTVASALSLLASKTPSIRARAGTHAAVSLAAPVAGFIAALVAVALFHAADKSPTVDTLQGWTCRWKQINMAMQPRFGSLCRQSEAGLILAILVMPLELCLLATAALQVFLEKRFGLAARLPASQKEKPQAP